MAKFDGSLEDTYSGTGSQTDFDVTFPFFRPEWLYVEVDSVAYPYADGGWVIDWTESDGIPEVVFIDAPPSGTNNVIIRRETVLDYNPDGGFRRLGEHVIDSVIYALQEMQTDIDAGGGGGTGVASWNSRTGAVVPLTSDYDASQVDNDSGVTGTTVADALDTLDAATGVTDHGGLTGLSDDDHPQYHNNARGDARYDPLGTASAVITVHEAGNNHALLHAEDHQARHRAGGADALSHDALPDFVAAEHIDWTAASAGTIDPSNYTAGGAGSDTTAIHDNVANEIAVLTLKGPPALPDRIILEDSAASWAKKYATLGGIAKAIISGNHVIAASNSLGNTINPVAPNYGILYRDTGNLAFQAVSTNSFVGRATGGVTSLSGTTAARIAKAWWSVSFGENGAPSTTTAGGSQWSMGNGETYSGDDGFAVAEDCVLVAMSATTGSNVSGGDTEIEAYKNGTATGESVTISSGTASGYDRSLEHSFSAGDRCKPVTVSHSGGGSTPSTVVMWFRNA